jgi:hypothetical protein
MYTNKATINTTASANGGSNFSTNWYWSSTEWRFDSAWRQSFGNGGKNDGSKELGRDVRAVRAF